MALTPTNYSFEHKHDKQRHQYTCTVPSTSKLNGTRVSLARHSRVAREKSCESACASTTRAREYTPATRALALRERECLLLRARARAREYCTCNSSLVYTTKRVTVRYLHCGGTKGKCTKMHLVSKISTWQCC